MRRQPDAIAILMIAERDAALEKARAWRAGEENKDEESSEGTQAA
jgi:hypothetical protein